jgi:hypothetical protein
MTPRTRRARGGLTERAIESIPPSVLDPLAPRQAEVVGWIAFGKLPRALSLYLTLFWGDKGLGTDASGLGAQSQFRLCLTGGCFLSNHPLWRIIR